MSENIHSAYTTTSAYAAMEFNPGGQKRGGATLGTTSLLTQAY
jgi:hypothetical protein